MSWPGLNASDGEMRIDPDVLNDVAATLERELRSLTGDALGTPANLRAEATIAAGLNPWGRWTTAVDMESGYRVARDSLLFYYEELIGQLQAAINLLRTTAAENQSTDESGQSAFSNQAAAMDAGGTASSGTPVRVA
jgi:hypothetical protein